jgi:hypothetical protein
VLVLFSLPTVEWAPTLSAGRKILIAAVSQSDNGCTLSLASIACDIVLTDRGFLTGVISTPEIAQFQLGDLTIKVHTPHWTKRFAQKTSALNLIPGTNYFA